jgi:hypothetical protein
MSEQLCGLLQLWSCVVLCAASAGSDSSATLLLLRVSYPLLHWALRRSLALL